MQEIKEILEKQKDAFAKFKKANDERLEALEAKGHTDPLLEEKVDKANAEITRLQDEMSELEKKLRRGPSGPGDGAGEDQIAHKDAFFGKTGFIRKGREDGLKELERKALNVTTPEDGGFAVPEEGDRTILALMKDLSPMRGVCKVITVGSPDYKRLVNVGGAGSGWVGEEDARPATDTPTLKQIAAVMGQIYANPQASQDSLDDIYYDVEGWLLGELAETFNEKEAAAFVSGNGVNKPKGFLDYAQASTADASRAFGTIQYVASGTSGAFKTASASVSPADDLITMIHAMKKALRAGASWMINSLTVAAIRKWKSYGTGEYIWSPGMQGGQPQSILGYPVVENEDMPDIGAGTTPVAFGNWSRAYTIVDRMGVRMLRDPYTNKPFVGFYTTKRVGGMLEDSQAIKLIKLAAS